MNKQYIDLDEYIFLSVADSKKLTPHQRERILRSVLTINGVVSELIKIKIPVWKR